MRCKVYFFIFAIIFLLGIISASLTIGEPEYSINSWYGKGQDIKGWINLSLEDEETDIEFTDSNENSIRLIDLLKTTKNSGLSYTCEPLDCSSAYVSSSGENSKTIIANAESDYYIGFDIDASISEIKDIGFDVTSDSTGEKINNQIKIDLFDDGVAETGNTKVGTQLVNPNPNYGCFNDVNYNSYGEEYQLGDDSQFCQKIELDEAPGFVLTTELKGSGTLNGLTLEIYKNNKETGIWEAVSNCQPGQSPGASWTTMTCDVDYLVTEKEDHYVCLYTSQSGNDIFEVKGYDNIDRCGFYGSFIPDETTYSFKIGAVAKKFAQIGTLTIENTLSDGRELTTLMEDYLMDKYGSLNCEENDCIIPMRIRSGVDQNIDLNNLELEYQIAGGPVSTQQNFYDLEKTAGTISMDFSKIYLDEGNFSVPEEEGDYNFELKLDGTEIIEEEVEVAQLAQITSISPTTTAAVIPTEFKVTLESDKNITSYEWNFNDSLTTKTTTENKVTYSFSETGIYEVIITITDEAGKQSSKTFQIEVGSAKNIIDDLLTNKKKYLEDIRTEVLGYEGFAKKGIESVLKLEEVDSKLSELETQYNVLGQDAIESEYQSIASELVAIELPESIMKTMDSTPISYYPASYNINLGALTTITGEEYDYAEENSYKEAVIGWNQLNADTKISMKGYSANYGFGQEPLVKVFELRIDKSSEDPAYLFIEDIEGLGFENNYTMTKSGNYYYKEVGSSEIVSFYTTADYDFTDVPAFVAPPINKLNLVDEGDISNVQEEGKEFKWLLFILVLIGIIFLGIIIYIVLQIWYKKRYENYLFKDKNAYYNMVNYVHRSKAQGKSDEQIMKSLKRAKWSNEQIRFVMKKYAGKRTGMAEIPVPKIGSSDKNKKMSPNRPGTGRAKNLKRRFPPKR